MSISKHIIPNVFVTVLGALLVTPAFAQGTPAPAGGGGVRTEMTMWIGDARDKLLQLAEATPEAKFSYRPAADVRSTGEVFMHVVTANYGIPSHWGVKPPVPGFTFAYEKSLTKKADIIKALKDSFAHVDASLAAVPEADMDKPVEMFGGMVKTTIRGGYMLLLAHSHEHLGQSIAYARTNGIAPPWTAAQQKAYEEMQKKAKAAPKSK